MMTSAIGCYVENVVVRSQGVLSFVALLSSARLE